MNSYDALSILAPIFAVLGGFMILLAMAGIVLYILGSLGLYYIANCRGIENAWLAWIPVGNSWLRGKVADQIGEHRGQPTNYAIIMLVCAAVTFCGGFVTSAVPFLGGLMVFAAGITLTVFNYISLYKIFEAHCPDRATLYLVLSIIFAFLEPIFIFVIRKQVPTDMAAPNQQPFHSNF